MRLVSICPSNTELVGYLDLTSSLVGIDDYSDWPGLDHLPRLGSDLDINMDKLEQLQPDLVLASLSVPGMEKNIERLNERNIPYVIVPNPKTLTEVAESIAFVGEVTNTKDKATQLVNRFHDVIKEYRSLAKQVEKPTTLYWEWWAKPIFTPGGTNWLTEISELAGGKNVFANSPEASVKTDWEDVRKRNVDVFCIVWVGVQTEKVNPKVILKREGATELQAIQQNRLYILEEWLYCRPSPKLLQGLQKVAHLLHPTIFPPYDEKKDPLLDV